MNISLLCKWSWRLDNEEGLWQNIVKAKYIKGAPIGAITHRPDDSPIWTDLLKIKYFYMRNRKVKVNNGQSTLFWEEPWMKEKPLCILHPVLYDLCLDKKISIHSVLIRGAHLNFCRWLPTILFDFWCSVIDEVFAYPYNNSFDEITWKMAIKESFLLDLHMTLYLPQTLGRPSHIYGLLRFLIESGCSCGWWRMVLS